MAGCQIGQVVRTDIPAAYGVISGFLSKDDLGYTNSGIRSKKLWYQEGDPIVDFMPGNGLPEDSAYRLSDPFFAKSIHHVDPVAELKALRKARSQGMPRLHGINLEGAIRFLEPLAKGQGAVEAKASISLQPAL